MTDVILTQKMDTVCQNTLRASIFYPRREKNNKTYIYTVFEYASQKHLYSHLYTVFEKRMVLISQYFHKRKCGKVNS